MYRKSVENTKNDLNMNIYQEMYLDTSIYSSPSISPTSTDSATSPLLHTTTNTMKAATSTNVSLSGQQCFNQQHRYFQQMQQQVQWGNSNSLGSAAIGEFELPKMGCANGLNVLPQQQQIQKMKDMQRKQSDQICAFIAPDATHQQHDEISKSLKMFAMQNAYKAGNDQGQVFAPQAPPVDAIMHDFARNGQICDEFSYFHRQAAQYYQANGRANLINAQSQLQQQQQQRQQPHAQPQQLNQTLNLNVSNNVWAVVPSLVQQQQPKALPATAAAVATPVTAAAKTDYSNYKKAQKRYNKNDKYAASKHCVFCENNNEPDEVVKSHSVRDAFGRVLCPKLRTYICPICKASGDMAHTVKYCPQKPIITMEDAIKAEAFRLAKGAYKTNNNNSTFNYNQQA